MKKMTFLALMALGLSIVNVSAQEEVALAPASQSGISLKNINYIAIIDHLNAMAENFKAGRPATEIAHIYLSSISDRLLGIDVKSTIKQGKVDDVALSMIRYNLSSAIGTLDILVNKINLAAAASLLTQGIGILDGHGLIPGQCYEIEKIVRRESFTNAVALNLFGNQLRNFLATMKSVFEQLNKGDVNAERSMAALKIISGKSENFENTHVMPFVDENRAALMAIASAIMATDWASINFADLKTRFEQMSGEFSGMMHQ